MDDPDPIVRPRRARYASIARLVAAFVLVGLIVTLTLQNTAAIDVRLLFWSLRVSLALLVFVLIVLATLLGWLLRSMRDAHGFRPLG